VVCKHGAGKGGSWVVKWVAKWVGRGNVGGGVGGGVRGQRWIESLGGS
jgi:hypothetical protein